MRKTLRSLGVVQNMGWLDRVIHFSVGALLMGVPIFLLSSGLEEGTWYLYCAMLLSIVPITMGVFGVEPIYSLFGVKSCGTSERNQCGTFPYEIDAALGHKPKPTSDMEHSLELSHH